MSCAASRCSAAGSWSSSDLATTSSRDIASSSKTIFSRPVDSAALRAARHVAARRTQRIYKLIAKVGEVVECDAAKRNDNCRVDHDAGEERSRDHHRARRGDAARGAHRRRPRPARQRAGEARADVRRQQVTNWPNQIAGCVAFQREQEMWDMTNELAMGRPGEAVRRWRQLTAARFIRGVSRHHVADDVARRRRHDRQQRRHQPNGLEVPRPPATVHHDGEEARQIEHALCARSACGSRSTQQVRPGRRVHQRRTIYSQLQQQLRIFLVLLARNEETESKRSTSPAAAAFALAARSSTSA